MVGRNERKESKMKLDMDKVYSGLNVDRESLIREIESMNGYAGVISLDYLRKIVPEIADDVAEDIYVSADLDTWSDDDIRLAVGRVLCNRLGLVG